MFILDRMVLNPLARVTRHAVAIGEGKDLTTRLDFKANDEIGILASEFDRVFVLDDGRLIEQGAFADLEKPGTALAGLLA